MKVQTLKETRTNKDLLQTEVAKLSNISPGYYCLIEKGLRNPSLKTAKNISCVLGLTLDEFYEVTANREEREDGLCQMDQDCY